jgi:NAD(P)-dependent dehydrogenase (short-subunit alcohol dehydrogenase family)
MAHALAQAGARVVVADLRNDLGEKVAESLGEEHGFVHLDVTDEGAGTTLSSLPPPTSADWTSWSTTPASRSAA